MSESFILQSYLEDISVCDDLIQLHQANPEKHIGEAVRDGVGVVDKTIKDSEESYITGDVGLRYMVQLQKVIDQYIQKYPQCNMYSPFGLYTYPQIQKYAPGGGYFEWHTERTNAKTIQAASRHLVFMTYLNDVTDAGETEFDLQKLKIQPRKGLTLIWPADWTHTHRGIASPTQEKYVVTGWLHYL
jgi:hypothetical protein